MHPTFQNQRHEAELVDIFPRTKIQQTNTINDPENGPVHVEWIMIRNVMESATEAELGGLFEKFQKAIAIRTSLVKMGHE